MKKLLFPVLLVALVSCGTKKKLPSGVMEPDKMKVVFWDMVRADQFLSAYVFAKDSTADKRRLSDSLYAVVFRIHHISPETFSKSFDYYRRNPEAMKALVDSVNSSVANTGNLNFNPPAYIDTSIHKGSLKAQ
jgi:hypothetical protein